MSGLPAAMESFPGFRHLRQANNLRAAGSRQPERTKDLYYDYYASMPSSGKIDLSYNSVVDYTLMEIPKTADIVIIGGGVMGASAAWHLARRGMKNIVLLEKENFFGQGATGRCAGGVRYQFSTEINIKLSLESLPMIERFKEELGQEVSYHQYGYLLVATDEKDAEKFRHNVELQ